MKYNERKKPKYSSEINNDSNIQYRNLMSMCLNDENNQCQY